MGSLLPRLSIVLATLLVTCGQIMAKERPRLTAADYEVTAMQSWKVHIERSLDEHPRRERAVQLLREKLEEVEKLLPASAVEELVKVPIWLSRDSSAGACYHPSRQWLLENGRVPEMARSIEIQNIDHFIDWSRVQPLMMLHELAHAWQDRMLEDGNRNAEVAEAFRKAEQSGIYQKVRHKDGRLQRHYGMTNPMEYFAECSEAYFGTNDFEPFDRKELEKFDPAGARLVERMWGIR
ncbi:MAG: hypothetical protein EOP85_05450 [Verrucomicrobiaceae bacterium]|nr:MAG: hypothetical protein EOP85_05450 [Verrucomicrobiaceae bacterium]